MCFFPREHGFHFFSGWSPTWLFVSLPAGIQWPRKREDWENGAGLLWFLCWQEHPATWKACPSPFCLSADAGASFSMRGVGGTCLQDGIFFLSSFVFYFYLSFHFSFFRPTPPVFFNGISIRLHAKESGWHAKKILPQQFFLSWPSFLGVSPRVQLTFFPTEWLPMENRSGVSITRSPGNGKGALTTWNSLQVPGTGMATQIQANDKKKITY